MDEFVIRGETGFIKVKIETVFGFPNRTSFAGGYDCKGVVELVSGSGNYSGKGELWFSTGEVYTFFESLNKCYKSLSGEAKFISTEANLDFTLDFRQSGHVYIEGYFKEKHENNTELKFEILSDQSYIPSTLKQLEEIKQKYGSMTGVRKQE